MLPSWRARRGWRNASCPQRRLRANLRGPWIIAECHQSFKTRLRGNRRATALVPPWDRFRWPTAEESLVAQRTLKRRKFQPVTPYTASALDSPIAYVIVLP